jgi:hypothetical protein
MRLDLASALLSVIGCGSLAGSFLPGCMDSGGNVLGRSKAPKVAAVSLMKSLREGLDDDSLLDAMMQARSFFFNSVLSNYLPIRGHLFSFHTRAITMASMPSDALRGYQLHRSITRLTRIRAHPKIERPCAE